MGCKEIGHTHYWHTQGVLYIQRCEIRCNFCDGEKAQKNWKYAWFLRRHVRDVHCLEDDESRKKKGSGTEKKPNQKKKKSNSVVYKDLTVSKDWKPPGHTARAYAKAQLKKRGTAAPIPKFGLRDQKPLPDPTLGEWVAPPKFEDDDDYDQSVGSFDPEMARQFNYDHVVNDVLHHPNILLGTDKFDPEADPMTGLLTEDDPEAFMAFIMKNCINKTTTAKSAETIEQGGDGDSESRFEGYNDADPELLEEMAAEFGVNPKTITRTPEAVEADGGDAEVHDAEEATGGDAEVYGHGEVDGGDAEVGDEMQIDRTDVRLSVEHVPLHEQGGNTENSLERSLELELTGNMFDHAPPEVPDLFFMSDASSPSDYSDLEDRPLAEYFDMAFPSGPTETQISMMGMLHTTVEELRGQGMENKDMLWSMKQFSRGLAMNGLALQHTPYEETEPTQPLEPFPFDQSGEILELE